MADSENGLCETKRNTHQKIGLEKKIHNNKKYITMFNDFDYQEFDDQFDNEDLLPFEENTKAFKAAKKDLAKVMPKPEEEEEIEDNDDFAGDWITITEDDGEDD